MVQIYSYQQSDIDDEEIILTSDDESEDEEDLTSAFIAKVDTDWQPTHEEKISREKISRPVRKAARKLGNGVKIFEPNTGLQASKVVSEKQSRQGLLSKKFYVAISSSSEEEN